MNKDHLSSTSLGTFRNVCLSAHSEGALIAGLTQYKANIYSIDLEKVADKGLFLDALGKAFNFPTKITNWDAASDLVWEKLIESTANQAALIFRNSQTLLNNNLQLFLDVLEFLFGVAEIIEREKKSSDTHPVLLRIILLGDGPNFPDWQ